MTTFDTSATWTEIHAQPDIWENWADQLADLAAIVAQWMRAQGITEIVLAGAGTSAFIGEIASFAPPEDKMRLRAVATTDIVSNPRDCLRDDPHLLVVQFGRSGESSESIGTLDLLDTAFPKVARLNITCNPDGALATRPPGGDGAQKVILLPDASHDAGFAMTSSFSTMLLSVLACLDPAAPVRHLLSQLAQRARAVLTQLAGTPPARPQRAIFLGSGALKGAARESALKVLELTAGETATSWDSMLGFRHGPKSVITGPDLVVCMIHPDPHCARYDRDVAAEIRAQYPEATVITMGGGDCDIELTTMGDARWDAVLYVLASQIWGVLWSADLGLNVDNPFEGRGTLSRVVSGVTLYPLKP